MKYTDPRSLKQSSLPIAEQTMSFGVLAILEKINHDFKYIGVDLLGAAARFLQLDVPVLSMFLDARGVLTLSLAPPT